MKIQLLEVQRLKTLTAGHPIMSKALEIREQGLAEKVQALSQGQKETRPACFLTEDNRGRSKNG